MAKRTKAQVEQDRLARETQSLEDWERKESMLRSLDGRTAVEQKAIREAFSAREAEIKAQRREAKLNAMTDEQRQQFLDREREAAVKKERMAKAMEGMSKEEKEAYKAKIKAQERETKLAKMSPKQRVAFLRKEQQQQAERDYIAFHTKDMNDEEKAVFLAWYKEWKRETGQRAGYEYKRLTNRKVRADKGKARQHYKPNRAPRSR